LPTIRESLTVSAFLRTNALVSTLLSVRGLFTVGMPPAAVVD